MPGIRKRVSLLIFGPHIHIPKNLNQQFKISYICNTSQIVCQMHLLVIKLSPNLIPVECAKKEWRYLTKPPNSWISIREGEVWPHRDTTSCKHSLIRGENSPRHAYQHQVDRHYGYLLSKAYRCLTSKSPAQLVHKFRHWVIETP
jgi:hypothetical protein